MIGVVEFKYIPRVRPTVTIDISTLRQLAASGETVALANDRFRGIVEARRYLLAPDAVLCWAAVYAGGLVALPDRVVARFGPRFLWLDAIAHEGDLVVIP